MTIPTPRIRPSRLRGGLLMIALVGFALSLLAVAPADAGDRVRFKNGHSIVAVKVTVEGDFVYLTMEDGSRVGFPKELVADLEEGVKAPRSRARNTSGYGGRGPSMRQLSGYQAQQRQAGEGLRLSGNTAQRDPHHKGPATYGFSYKGSGYNGGMQRQRTNNAINVFDYMYQEDRGVQRVNASDPVSADVDGEGRNGQVTKTRAMPVIKPFDGNKKPKKKGLETTNPNVPPTQR